MRPLLKLLYAGVYRRLNTQSTYSFILPPTAQQMRSGANQSAESAALLLAQEPVKVRRASSKHLSKTEVVDAVKQWATRTFKRKTAIDDEDVSNLLSQLDLAESGGLLAETAKPAADDVPQAIASAIRELEDAGGRDDDNDSYHSATTGFADDDGEDDAIPVPPRDRAAAAQPPLPAPLVFDMRGNLVRPSVLKPPPLEVRKASVQANTQLFEANVEELPPKSSPKPIAKEPRDYRQPAYRSTSFHAPFRHGARPTTSISVRDTYALIDMSRNPQDWHPNARPRPGPFDHSLYRQQVVRHPSTPSQQSKRPTIHIMHHEEIMSDEVPLYHLGSIRRDQLQNAKTTNGIRPHTMFNPPAVVHKHKQHQSWSICEEADRARHESNGVINYVDTLTLMDQRRESALTDPSLVGDGSCRYVREQAALWQHREDHPVHWMMMRNAARYAANKRAHEAKNKKQKEAGVMANAF